MGTHTTQRRFGHAVVIGGSMGGLLAARVLADHFERVTLVERDALPHGAAQRKGVPQGRHAHGLLANGFSILARLFPDLEQGLVADGAMPGDMAGTLRWFHMGAWKLQFESGFRGVYSSRPLLESHVRRRVLALPNLAARDECDVEGLVTSDDRARVTGVRLRSRRTATAEPEMLAADLVVDATGRGSRSPQWLESLDYDRVPESVIRIDVGYATRIYRRRAGDIPGAEAMIISPTPPADKRCAVLLPMEGDRWILTLGGWCGDHAPTDEGGFLAFARSLAAPAIGDFVARAEPLGEITIHRFPSNLRRHYERMRRFPEGYLVFGDALSSFNPIYGQGMTSSAMQSRALGEVMTAARRSGRLDGTWRTFFRRAARVVDIPWTVTAGEDFRYPEVEGPRPPATDLVNRYVAQLHRASSQDEEVYRAFLHVMNLAKSPPSVFAPATALRVGLAALRRRGARLSAESRDWVRAPGSFYGQGGIPRQ